MADLGHRLTDKELAALERRILQVYRDAAKDLQKTVEEYFAKFVKRDKEQQELLKAGKITEEQYKQWRLAQIGRGERFEDLRDKMAERYTKANETAIAYVNDSTPGIYSLNRNYSAYTIEQVHGDVGFTLFDEQTVKRLIVEEPDVMPYYPPERAVNRGIDLAYGKRQISAAVTSGILRGLPVGQIANELQGRVKDMNRTSAIRAARTATTNAQNAGRQDSYEQAAKMGIQVRKRWMATKDMRTRHEHGMADGQTVGHDQPFIVGGEKLMFPGDRSGSPWNTYNCRCTMQTVEKEGIEVEPRQMRVRNPVTGRNELVSEMTYPEWYEWKRSQDTEAVDRAKKKATSASSDKAQYEKYRNVIKGKAGKSFEDFQDMKYTDAERWSFLKLDYARRNKLINHPEMALPNVENAIVADAKFTGYLFNPENPKGWAKGQAFTSRLGYSSENWEKLQAEIVKGSKRYAATPKGEIAQGERYEQLMVLYGPSDRPTNVVVAWLKNPDGGVHMTSAYIKEVK